MTTSGNSKQKLWQLTALTEALGDLELPIADKVSVGRGKDNDVVLGSKQISRQHAELTVVDDVLQVTDLGSSNGTLVNDVQIEPNQPVALNLNDIVSFAVFSFKVEKSKVKVASTAPVVDDSSTQQPTTPEVTETVETEHTKTVAEPVSSNEPSTDEIQQSVTPETVEQISEEKLEEALEAELEEPIAYGNPNQQQKPAPVADNKINTESPAEEKAIQPNSKEHFEKLAEEADEEVHKSKQAAAAKMSGTTDAVEETTQNPVKDATTVEQKQAQNFSENFNTVKETQQHNVAHVKNSTPVPQTGKKGGTKPILWIVLILLALVAALWLFNTGALR